MKRIQFLFFILALLAGTVLSQERSERGKNEFTVWGGVSPDSTNGFLFAGKTPDVRFAVIGFRYSRRFNNSRYLNLKYTADVFPVAFLSYPDSEADLSAPAKKRDTRPLRTAIGIQPFGIQLNLRPRKAIRPFARASAGFMYVNKRTPNYVGTRFEFTASFGGGIEIGLKKGRAISVGYSYFHISNGYRGDENPGFDNNLFWIGYTFRSM